jgi:hypothetical protein
VTISKIKDKYAVLIIAPLLLCRSFFAERRNSAGAAHGAAIGCSDGLGPFARFREPFQIWHDVINLLYNNIGCIFDEWTALAR